jgi:Fe-S-cluster containining protein
MSTMMPAPGRLRHLGRLTIHRLVFTQRFTAGCATSRCDASCCVLGVLVDVAERDRVLAEAERVRALMTPEQEHDPARWFSREELRDRDFPSGRASHTRATQQGCIFLDAERRCTLHRAGLKPFFCTIFPLTVADGVLLLESEPDGLSCATCCAPVPDGPLTVFDVCGMELEHALGRDGVATLQRLAGDRSPHPASPP